MDFLRTRLDHLVNHLRGCIARGELSEPLPNTREWSHKLRVSRTTLTTALKTLEKEGALSIHPRHGVKLSARKPRPAARVLPEHRVVRMAYFAPDYPEPQTDLAVWFLPLAERLHDNDIQVTFERCSDARLRALCRRGERPQELVFLLSVPGVHEKLFSAWKRSVLLVGKPAAQVRLPYVTVDTESSVRHATLTLMQHGLPAITLLLNKGGAPGIQRVLKLFEATCSEWRRRPVRGEVVRVPLDVEPMALQVRRLIVQIEPPHGVIVVRPVPLETILTALLVRGLSVPKQVEVIGVDSTPATARSCPSVSHYPIPVEQLVKALTDAALHYFESGSLPPLRRAIPVEKVPSLRR